MLPYTFAALLLFTVGALAGPTAGSYEHAIYKVSVRTSIAAQGNLDDDSSSSSSSSSSAKPSLDAVLPTIRRRAAAVESLAVPPLVRQPQLRSPPRTPRPPPKVPRPPPKVSPPPKGSPPPKPSPPAKPSPPPALSPAPMPPPPPKPSPPATARAPPTVLPPTPQPKSVSPSPQLSPPLRQPSQSPPPPRGCFDDPSLPCSDWKDKGYCEPTPYYIYQDLSVRSYWCPLACGTCQCSDNTTGLTDGSCVTWKQKGGCRDGSWSGSSNLTIKNYWCPKTCGTCGCADMTSSTAGVSNCAAWKQAGYCASGYWYGAPSWTIRDYWCPLTCEACGGFQVAPPPSPLPPPAPLPPIPPPPSPKPPPFNGTYEGGCVDPAAALGLHNTYRRRHGSDNLIWDNTLASRAQAWATKLATNSCALAVENSTDAVGENLYGVYFPAAISALIKLNCSDAVAFWYSKGLAAYAFTSHPFTDNMAKNAAGGFTQIVWASSARLGCGAAKGKDCLVAVCRYTPPGNIATDADFLENVRPLNTAAR